MSVGVCAMLGMSFAGAPAEAASYSDVSENSRFYSEINYLSDLDVIKGYADGTFRSGKGVSRLEAAIMITRAFNLNPNGKSPYKDVPDHSQRYVEAARQAGIIKGYSKDSFRPYEKVSRGEMAMFLSRAFKLETTNKVYFKDVGKRMAAYHSVQQMAEKGIAYGYSDYTYRANDTVTRGQFSAFLTRGLKGGGEPAKPLDPSKPNGNDDWYNDITDDIAEEEENSDIIDGGGVNSSEFD